MRLIPARIHGLVALIIGLILSAAAASAQTPSQAPEPLIRAGSLEVLPAVVKR